MKNDTNKITNKQNIQTPENGRKINYDLNTKTTHNNYMMIKITKTSENLIQNKTDRQNTYTHLLLLSTLQRRRNEMRRWWWSWQSEMTMKKWRMYKKKRGIGISMKSMKIVKNDYHECSKIARHRNRSPGLKY